MKRDECAQGRLLRWISPISCHNGWNERIACGEETASISLRLRSLAPKAKSEEGWSCAIGNGFEFVVFRENRRRAEWSRAKMTPDSHVRASSRPEERKQTENFDDNEASALQEVSKSAGSNRTQTEWPSVRGLSYQEQSA